VTHVGVAGGGPDDDHEHLLNADHRAVDHDRDAGVHLGHDVDDYGDEKQLASR
jgi:hypothetical protein